jgi:hypothetical protein
MRDQIAALMWKTQSINAGAPQSVANGRTLEAFADAGDEVCGYWLKQSAAILAALPDMIAPLVWGLHALPDILHHYSDHYTLICMADGYLVDFDDLSLGHGYTLEQAKAAANTHHRAAIMAAFTGETQ